jgi:threonine/homoserine/homoserine lactone efflux protein
MLSSLYWLGFALAASPGPDFFLIMRHSLNGGRFMGYVTLAGNRLSLCLHMAFAVLGLSIILQQSNALLVAVRLLGAAYLTYLGARNLRERFRGARRAAVAPAAGASTPALAFRSGFLNNLLNPKVSLFFLSLFPQFTSPDLLTHSPLTVAAAFFAGNTSWWIPLVFVAGMSRLRAGMLRFQQGLDIVFGILFIGYGLQVAAEIML